jgi:hypothetical protein
MDNDESRLDGLFQSYRVSCPEIEPGPNFMPALWQRIEARHNFWFVFRGLARTTVTASAALCLLLLILNLLVPAQSYLPAPTYTDALMADHSAENLYYTEGIRSAPAAEPGNASRPR